MDLRDLVVLLLFGVMLLEGAALVALTRLVGTLYLRIGPVSAPNLDTGPPLGSELTEIRGANRFGAPDLYQIPMSSSVLVFLREGCKACHSLQDSLGAFAKSYELPVAAVVLGASTGSFARATPSSIPLLASSTAEDQFKVQGTPFAIWLEDRIVVAKGVVNHIEHLESLRETASTTPATGAPIVPTGAPS